MMPLPPCVELARKASSLITLTFICLILSLFNETAGWCVSVCVQARGRESGVFQYQKGSVTYSEYLSYMPVHNSDTFLMAIMNSRKAFGEHRPPLRQNGVTDAIRCSGSPPKFNNLFLVLIPTLFENFNANSRSTFSRYFVERQQTDKCRKNIAFLVDVINKASNIFTSNPQVLLVL